MNITSILSECMPSVTDYTHQCGEESGVPVHWNCPVTDDCDGDLSNKTGVFFYVTFLFVNDIAESNVHLLFL
jgi:hypothetical protein